MVMLPSGGEEKRGREREKKHPQKNISSSSKRREGEMRILSWCIMSWHWGGGALCTFLY